MHAYATTPTVPGGVCVKSGATEKESPRQALGPTICAMAESWSGLTRSRRVGSTHELEQLRMIWAGYRGRWRVVWSTA
jgi:hypothetical protein